MEDIKKQGLAKVIKSLGAYKTTDRDMFSIPIKGDFQLHLKIYS